MTRSIFSRWSDLCTAKRSPMITIRPEIASMKLCAASEIIAIEFDNMPMMILRAASRKLVAIKRMPDLTMIFEREFDFVVSMYYILT